ncbi:type VII secretion protein EssA [Metabacillus sp. 84]|uniref:type VII secretion protein EssA n=1 Tax=Metabacillus sp. 84 TaxID=3404705 RepID=UPI003CEC0D7D
MKTTGNTKTMGSMEITGTMKTIGSMETTGTTKTMGYMETVGTIKTRETIESTKSIQGTKPIGKAKPRNNWKMAALLTAALFFLIPAAQASAEETDTIDIEDLEPNIYQKETIKPKTDYFKDESLYNKRQAIPEAQKDLVFTMPDPDPFKEIRNELFTAYSIENDTTGAKAKQLELFLNSDQLFQTAATPATEEELQEAEQATSSLTILYMIIIGIGLLLILVLIIPRMTAGKKEEL